MSIYLGTTPIASTGYDKANIDLSNLTSTGKNIANWSSNVTNCITEIPQDIKLELDNGTLTLKAGSKVYVPNGFEADGVTPKFDVVTINSDITTTGYLNSNIMVFYYLSTNIIGIRIIDDCVSGSSTTKTDYYNFYNTITNKLGSYGASGTLESYLSLPICICKSNNGAISSIDQVFNGFGYIGSTVFALPGVKGLIPNGRNADGTLKNIEVTVSNVLTMTTGAINIPMVGQLFPTGLGEVWKLCYTEGNKEPSNTIGWNVWYNTNDNISYLKDTSSSSSVWTPQYGCNGCFKFTVDSSGKITSLNTKTAFHALGYNDSSTISGWSMPSSRYIDLTLGASGATYTAPANGYFYIAGTTTSSNGFYSIGGNIGMRVTQPSSSTGLNVFTPAKKGERVSVYYVGINTTAFRFVYAEGEN